MAIAFDLDIATSRTALEIAGELCEVAKHYGVFEEDVSPHQVVSAGVLTKLETWIQVFDVSPRPWDPVRNDFGFTRTVSVMFHEDKFTDMSAQDDDMVRLVSGLFDRVAGDAVLHLDYETILLLRRGGDLSVNEADDIWPPERLALVHQPYRRATYTFS